MGRAVRREKSPAGTHLLAQFYKGPCMLRPRTEEPPLISNPGGGNYCTARRGGRDGAARALRERGRRNGTQWLCFRLCPRSMRSLRPLREKERPKVPCYIRKYSMVFRNGALRRAGAYWKIQSFLGLVFVFLVC